MSVDRLKLAKVNSLANKCLIDRKPSLIKTIETFLEDPDKKVREYAIAQTHYLYLRYYPQEEKTKRLFQKYLDPGQDQPIRLKTIQILEGLNNSDEKKTYYPTLLNLFTDPDQKIRQKALETFVLNFTEVIASPEKINLIKSILENNTSPEIRQMITCLTCNLPYSNDLTASQIVKEFNQYSPELYPELYQSLTNLPNDFFRYSDGESLLSSLISNDCTLPEIRDSALSRLARTHSYNDPILQKNILVAIEDNDPGIRNFAQELKKEVIMRYNQQYGQKI